MELLAIVAGLQLAANIKISMGEIVADALGCCQIANRRKKHPQLTNNHIALMGPLQYYLKDFEDTLRLTPAHPEKRNSMSVNWSRDDCLNHVADRIAEGQTGIEIDCQFKFIQIQTEAIMRALDVPHSWHERWINTK